MPQPETGNAAHLLDELACQRLVVRFVHALDSGDGAAAAALFSSDGIWRRQGTDVAGRDAIAAAIGARVPTLVIRHHFTNIKIDIQSPDRATGLSYYCLYRAEIQEGAKPPYSISTPMRCGTNRHTFVRDQGEWLMQFNEAHPTFAFK